MCAINPRYKKRMIFDFYTAHNVTKEAFEEAVIEYCLKAEQTINAAATPMSVRCHVKESQEQAD